MNPLFMIIHISYGIVSWILYIVVTKYIYRHRKQFNSAFTRLWNTFTIINLMQYLTMKVYYQIPLHVPADSEFADYLRNFSHQQPLTMLYFSAYYFVYCQRICIMLIISISFRVIVFPFSSSPIWERQYIVTALIVFGLPIPFLVQIFYMEPAYNYLSYLDGFILYPPIAKNPRNAIRNMLQSNFFEITTAVLSGGLKLSSLFCLSTSSVRKRDDRNLYVVTTILFATSLLKFACAILMVLNLNIYLQMLVVYTYPITADMVALSCPYTLLFINKRMRSYIFTCSWISKLRNQKEDTNGTSV